MYSVADKNFLTLFVREVEITSNDKEPYENEMILSRESEDDRIWNEYMDLTTSCVED